MFSNIKMYKKIIYKKVCFYLSQASKYNFLFEGFKSLFLFCFFSVYFRCFCCWILDIIFLKMIKNRKKCKKRNHLTKCKLLLPCTILMFLFFCLFSVENQNLIIEMLCNLQSQIREKEALIVRERVKCKRLRMWRQNNK